MTLSSLIGPFDRLVVKSPRLSRVADARSRKLAALLSKSGRTGSPSEMSRVALSRSLASAAVTIPVGIALGSLLWVPFAALCAVPIFVYLYPEFVLKDAAASRREGVERELPFFAVLVNVLGGAGLSLYSIMLSGVGKGTFVSVEKEALRLKRDVEIFGAEPLDALESLATNHPSRKFGDFVLGYCSKVRSGGDIAVYLSGESGELLRDLEVAWARYAARIGAVGSLMVTGFGVVPLLLLVVGFFSPGFAVEGLDMFSLVAVPLLTIALVTLAGRMQPMGDEPLRGGWTLGAGSAGAALLLGLLTRQLWIEAALPLFAFCLVYGYSVKAQRKVMKEEEEAIPRFLKDVTEFKRLDYDLGKSLVTISAQFHYGRVFDEVLEEISAKLRSGISLDEARPEPKTALGRIVFFVLGQMAYSGGGSVDTMFQLTHHTTRVIEMKQDSRSEVKPYLFLSYVTPLLLVFGVAFVGGVLSNFGANSGAAASMRTLQFGGSALGPDLFQAANLLIVVSATALGFVGAKMTDLTVRNTLRASTNLAIAVAALVAVPLLNISTIIR